MLNSACSICPKQSDTQPSTSAAKNCDHQNTFFMHLLQRLACCKFLHARFLLLEQLLLDLLLPYCVALDKQSYSQRQGDPDCPEILLSMLPGILPSSTIFWSIPSWPFTTNPLYLHAVKESRTLQKESFSSNAMHFAVFQCAVILAFSWHAIRRKTVMKH